MLTDLLSGIYTITNTVNGKVYVGQALNIAKRWERHRRELDGGYHKNPHLQSAWNKYGADAFVFQVLEYCGVDDLDDREIDFIISLGSFENGYNFSLGGGGRRGYVPTEETRRKQSAALKGKTRSPLSEETKRKISEANLGRPPHNLGKNHTDESKRKMSESKKGNSSNLGKSMSVEARRKISEALKGNQSWLGKKHTDEAKRKMSEAATLRWAKKINQTEGHEEGNF